MTPSLNQIGLENIQFCESSFKRVFGEMKLAEFKQAVKKLNDLFVYLEKSGVNVYFWVTERKINYEFKDTNGHCLLDGCYEENETCKPFVILGSAIAKVTYLLNKKISHAIELVKS